MFDWLRNLFKGETIVKVKNKIKTKTVVKEVEVKSKAKFNGICDFCRKPIQSQLVNTFYCKYCDRWYCEEHRLPSNHECPDPKKPSEYKKGPVEVWSDGRVEVRGH